MALSNSERIFKALEHLRTGLSGFFLTQVQKSATGQWSGDFQLRDDGSVSDVAQMLKIMKVAWAELFQPVLGHSNRVYIFECSDIRNRFAHQESFSHDDTWRALDTIQRLLTAVGAGKEIELIYDLKEAFYNVNMREKIRTVERKEKKEEGPIYIGLVPWREVISPQLDVIEGTFKQAEFAADLDEVLRGRARPEYQDAKEFFQRTYLTRGLSTILKAALLRLSSRGGDPVVELQTRFGGGKTHSMIALYHLAQAKDGLMELPGIEDLLRETGVNHLGRVHCAVITGNQYGPNQAYTMPDGTVIRTLWGLMAWQLGAKDGYTIIQGSDESATAPGKEELQELLQKFNPCLIMMDELVTYCRQLPEDQQLSGGNMDAAATFIQSLSEAVKNTNGSMMIASLPASEIEVGGTNGARVLERLQNILRRVHVSWSPAAEDETYEIIRRRLFGQPSSEILARSGAVIKKFIEYYRETQASLPPEIRKSEYFELMCRCYPIHPEVFDKLYKKWSSIDRFQQTRGVLRFMANVIHQLWESGDQSPLILPGQIPFSDPKVRDNITGYMEDNWKPVLDHDVDGSNSMARRVDTQNSQFGAYHLARRISRTVLLGSAPVQNNRGVTFPEICLGCAVPPQKIPQMRDALNTLLQESTYLYQENDRYFYDTKASLNRTAQDLAREFRPDDVEFYILGELQNQLKRDHSGFSATQVIRPGTEVPDEQSLRLVILPPSASHTRQQSKAVEMAQKILKSRGSAHREFQNCLIFLAADAGEVKDLESMTRQLMAWDRILKEEQERDITPSQKRMVQTRLNEFKAQLPIKVISTWQHILYPESGIGSEVVFSATKPRTGDSLAQRVFSALKDEDVLASALGFNILKQEIESNNLTRGETHIELSRLYRDFCSFLYLRRLQSQQTLIDCIDSFYRDPTQASSEWLIATGRQADGTFSGLQNKFGQGLRLTTLGGFLVRRAAVESQLIEPAKPPAETPPSQPPMAASNVVVNTEPVVTETPKARQFYTSFDTNPEQLTALSRQISAEILPHLVDEGAEITITVSIDAKQSRSGFSEHTRRTLLENARSLGGKQTEMS